ncbi:MAG: 4-diphosphocytidyl-2-C-methyl-D-erythritol kinase [Acidimicrobiaceae bacterium]|nr:4-diphosphocytidyl-2-C-methyl-D-erythritol kinase [Acidimicrobiaceae bacterium]
MRESVSGVEVVEGEVQAFAKLTLSLEVVGVRDDGYHLIDAEMVSIDLCDTLVFSAGVNDLPADNLVSLALAAVGRDAHVSLVKRIPAGAGLGGGSADAAAVLRWAGCRNLSVAVAVGADVPFCVVGGRARVRGIGEVVEPLPFVDKAFTLLTPPLHVSTPAVYAMWDRLGGERGLAGAAGGGGGLGAGVPRNDLVAAALAVAPDLARWRDRLGDATGQTPGLAGSGGTWFVEGEYEGDGLVVTRTVPPPG